MARARNASNPVGSDDGGTVDPDSASLGRSSASTTALQIRLSIDTFPANRLAAESNETRLANVPTGLTLPRLDVSLDRDGRGTSGSCGDALGSTLLLGGRSASKRTRGARGGGDSSGVNTGRGLAVQLDVA